MSEPGLLSSASQTETEKRSLWDDAPAWRNLTIAASLLTAVAATLPLALTPPAAERSATDLPAQSVATSAEPSCSIAMPAQPPQLAGTVIGFISHDQSVQIFRNTERISGSKVNPSYAADARAMVRPDPGNGGGARNPLIPPALHVAIGDHVTYQGPYRDPSLPCGFVPSLITSDQGPAAAAKPAP